jgi:hypothetical protein
MTAASRASECREVAIRHAMACRFEMAKRYARLARHYQELAEVEQSFRVYHLTYVAPEGVEIREAA